MKITKTEVTLRDLFVGFTDNKDKGVKAYGGRLNIRPAYQREFVYKDAQRDAVIDTALKGFPLNTLYWVKTGEDAEGNPLYEVLDGQQRTISLCQYSINAFSVLVGTNPMGLANLPRNKREAFLDYTLDVYVCEGGDDEKLEWFRTINIAGEVLTDQELRNATYPGEWLFSAKQFFSRTGAGTASQIAGDYLKGSAIRQEFLETALWWRAHSLDPKLSTKAKDEGIKDYMREYQGAKNADDLKDYFQAVIRWVETVFPNKHKNMKGREWGIFYNKYKDSVTASAASTFSTRIPQLIQDPDVTNHKGIYEYLLSGDERHLSLRAFLPEDKEAAYERQDHKCIKCEEEFDLEEMQADHIVPWSKGGKTVPENCQLLCQPCNATKSNK